MQQHIFIEWCVLDGHATKDLEAIELARDHGFIMPLHFTHELQSLNVGFKGLLSTFSHKKTNCGFEIIQCIFSFEQRAETM